MTPANPRSTTIRDQHRRRIARTKPPCGLCGNPIDYTLRYPHPMSYVVDHIVPIAAGGTNDATNLHAAHRRCNSVKSDRLAPQPTARKQPRTFITHRTW